MAVKKYVELEFDFGGNFDAEDEFAEWIRDGGIASDLANAAADGARRFILDDPQWDGKRPGVTGESDVFRQLCGQHDLKTPVPLGEDAQATRVEFFKGPLCSVTVYNDGAMVVGMTYDLELAAFVDRDFAKELDRGVEKQLWEEILPGWARSELRWR